MCHTATTVDHAAQQQQQNGMTLVRRTRGTSHDQGSIAMRVQTKGQETTKGLSCTDQTK
eukprot:CAMPEP_0183511560 /NCGR_PEP_ID=MMETSP0371-20130417/10977_1 /TAXON_ID=268820 /ORGANISM="Peridinium aciculiferum, Strain PAER-2" /LENGTH=58 /DNA_ID=CAMNT_0025708493 /DNA_START=22 /DNA_END=198 /DNA_ORIENTATION=+